MRIFIISRGYPTEKYITNGIFEYDQAKALAARGHEVVFLVLDMRSLKKKRPMGQVSILRDNVHIEIINFPVSDFWRGLTRFVRERSLKKLYRICVKKYGTPDIIHAHFQEIAYCTARVLKDEGIPMVMTEHLSKLINHEFSKELEETGKNTYPHYKEIISVSKGLAKSLSEKFGVTSVIIPNIVDLDNFQYSKANDRKDPERFRVISVGHLKKVKRMDDLIISFGAFHENHPDSDLRIIGMGTEYSRLQKLVNDKKLNDCITLEGKTLRNEIAEKMRTADCFALFSGSETFGVAFIEAISMGLPVISTRCQGPEDFVTEENGVLVEPGNIGEMVKAFEYMYDNRDKFDSEKISKAINRKYSPEVIAAQIESVYSQTIHTKE